MFTLHAWGQPLSFCITTLGGFCLRVFCYAVLPQLVGYLTPEGIQLFSVFLKTTLRIKPGSCNLSITKQHSIIELHLRNKLNGNHCRLIPPPIRYRKGLNHKFQSATKMLQFSTRNQVLPQFTIFFVCSQD